MKRNHGGLIFIEAELKPLFVLFANILAIFTTLYILGHRVHWGVVILRKNSATAGSNIGHLNKNSGALSSDPAIVLFDILAISTTLCTLGCMGVLWFLRTNSLCLSIPHSES